MAAEPRMYGQAGGAPSSSQDSKQESTVLSSLFLCIFSKCTVSSLYCPCF